MGKASKKLVKKQQKTQLTDNKQKVTEFKKRFFMYRDTTEYEKSLEVLAELIKLKCYEPEVLYTGAFCYFMIGDYTRAADWVNNTLSYAPSHIDARILLGRICILEDRTEDGLSVLDFVLEHNRASLTAAQKDVLHDILNYYGKYEMEKMQAHYPHIASFCGENDKKDILQEPSVSVPSTDEDAAGKVSVEPVGQEASDAVENRDVTHAVTSENLQDKLESLKTDILNKPVPMAEKMKLLNSFAGAYYFDHHLDAAEYLLQAALELDAYHDASLRNMAYVMLGNGRVEDALEYASKMSMADFGLLHRLQN